MIIGIEGYQTEALIFGRACSKKELRHRMKEVLQLRMLRAAMEDER